MDMIIDFRERERERERDGEKHQLVVSPMRPNKGPNTHPRHVS